MSAYEGDGVSFRCGHQAVNLWALFIVRPIVNLQAFSLMPRCITSNIYLLQREVMIPTSTGVLLKHRALKMCDLSLTQAMLLPLLVHCVTIRTFAHTIYYSYVIKRVCDPKKGVQTGCGERMLKFSC